MDLVVQKREILGKKVKVLREEDLIPAELYGYGHKNIHLSVSAKDFLKIFREAGESTIIKLKIEGEGDAINALVYDVQKNHLTDKIIHIDFYAVRMDKKITTSVPLEFVGVSPAVKEKEGILVKTMQEIEVEALPTDLPHNIKVDISQLSEIGTSIYVKNLNLGKGVKSSVAPDTVVATITEQAKEEEVKGPATIEEVKVEAEVKKEKEQLEEKEAPQKTE